MLSFGEAFGISFLLITKPNEILNHMLERTTYGIRPADALHLASAVMAEAEAFCTTDAALLRRGREAETNQTAVASPTELITRLEP